MISVQTRKVIAAGMIGNVLEWYDFAIYGYFAAIIGLRTRTPSRSSFPRSAYSRSAISCAQSAAH